MLCQNLSVLVKRVVQGDVERVSFCEKNLEIATQVLEAEGRLAWQVSFGGIW